MPQRYISMGMNKEIQEIADRLDVTTIRAVQIYRQRQEIQRRAPIRSINFMK